jgi:hypothetical protein
LDYDGLGTIYCAQSTLGASSTIQHKTDTGMSILSGQLEVWINLLAVNGHVRILRI